MGRPAGPKIYAHAKLRRLRRERGMNQVELARALGLSTSYLNQIEHSQRPLTAPVLLRIAEVFGVDPEFFSEAEEERLATDLRAALGDEACGAPIAQDEIADVARDHPEVARALVTLHQRYRDASERVAALASPEDTAGLLPAEPHDEVRDFFYAHHNHFAALETEAEAIAEALGIGRAGRAADALTKRLAVGHGIKVLRSGPERSADARRFDADSGVLLISPWLSEGQSAFQLATQLAFLEHGALLDQLVDTAALTSPQAEGLARIGLANYFAGAVLMPYTAFHTAAEELRYDIELLQARFGVGFETVCHRLSTLQRTGRRGVPFSFLRADRAGNISKRQSATDFHFSRLGGTCPLWTVYEAFSAPGRILTQVAEMPDGKKYFWIARTVTRGGFGHHAPRADFAVALGCELRHAPRLVYAEGIALTDPRAVTPIGLGCRICERQDCAQRARPPAGGVLAVDPDRRALVPYPVVSEH
ncbi:MULTISPECIES: short-chain fatty acyl-CoA regulator family protein [Streptomyces]|uniref:Transcriptional regulator, XRE family n=1 Tax=Streptomyces venezuelae (strain ATCC 10712 / CBS 650.69 / DSM 40230 / JCM 4526 / NBRC 13096 / PD 04745) TaxID=953739 RepID=F2R858_STRVP|nr:short-chain fatty acyl-CoA regulator family protein [Streptomyces venezuelae]APE24430.1 Cro/Cl family transcriptional regulator [Streptomyces venezuelae]QES01796.1 XRE family transcriptional regulator [Streptomyces venezuelae ATCC 10712]CCA58867.1 Transcriptional regulator, XRE family [Streptomyces venezuelae ATCC 10712]